MRPRKGRRGTERCDTDFGSAVRCSSLVPQRSTGNRRVRSSLAKRFGPSLGEPALGRPGRSDVENGQRPARPISGFAETIFYAPDEPLRYGQREADGSVGETEEPQETDVFQDDVIVLGEGRGLPYRRGGRAVRGDFGRKAQAAPGPGEPADPGRFEQSLEIQGDPVPVAEVCSSSPVRRPSMISSSPSTQLEDGSCLSAKRPRRCARFGLGPPQGGERRNGVDDIAQRARPDDQEFFHRFGRRLRTGPGPGEDRRDDRRGRPDFRAAGDGDPPAVFPDDGPFRDGGLGVVGALGVDVGPQRPEDLSDVGFVEDEDIVDVGEGREDFGPFAFWGRTGRPGPFSRRREASLLRATIRISPSFLAARR